MNQFTLFGDEEFHSLVQRAYETLMDGDGATVEDATKFLDSYADRYKEDIWEKGDRVLLLRHSGQLLNGIMFYSTRSYTHRLGYTDQLDYNDELARQARLVTSLYGAPTDREFTPKRELTWRLPAGGGITLGTDRDLRVDVLTVAGMELHDVAFKPRQEYF